MTRNTMAGMMSRTRETDKHPRLRGSDTSWKRTSAPIEDLNSETGSRECAVPQTEILR